ncbi:cupin domain-containing protein [Streptomyces antimycoticus]
MGNESRSDLALTSTVVAEAFARWSPELRKEFDTNAHNGRVGQSLVKETDSLRIWETSLQPGERIPVHRHVVDYFWIALTSGRARQHSSDGTTHEIFYVRGRSRHFCCPAGRYHLHDLKNIGDEVLSFLTIETKGGPNEPIQL